MPIWQKYWDMKKFMYVQMESGAIAMHMHGPRLMAGYMIRFLHRLKVTARTMVYLTKHMDYQEFIV